MSDFHGIVCGEEESSSNDAIVLSVGPPPPQDESSDYSPIILPQPSEDESSDEPGEVVPPPASPQSRAIPQSVPNTSPIFPEIRRCAGTIVDVNCATIRTTISKVYMAAAKDLELAQGTDRDIRGANSHLKKALACLEHGPWNSLK
eukprot:gnl/Dysnectes_brevis/4470_a6021_756.p1 GENE.gnl/Dysnectes_brevis/4470_a6021_756~~gnl/Dysnectes_brevis/4470_a6021_756.p1  ORF type:complete len:146 (+),score=8.92 gnl/Dysnectes_brevis/4470_a6021_756:47-484(+)